MAMYYYQQSQFTPPSPKRRRPNTYPFMKTTTAPPPVGRELFGLLPDDCTQAIFSFLPSARDRCACAAVCKRWLVLLAHMRGCEFNPFRFAKKYVSCSSPQAPNHHPTTTKKGNYENEEEASRCLEAKEANDARLAAMAVGTYARRLLGNLSVRCGSLPSLSQQRVTDFGLLIVSQSFPNLRSLSLWDCFKVGSSGLASIARCCRALEKLDISNSPRIDDEGLVPIARNCPNLSALTLQSCPLVGNRSLLALARCSSHLQSISISRCPQVGDAGIVSVVSHLPNLTRIRLAQLRLGHATLEAIGRHSGSIRALSLEGIAGLTASGLSCLSRLESLSLRSCVAASWDHHHPRMAPGTPTFEALRHVSIRDCRFLRDEILSGITRSTRHLESLRLDRCDGVTTAGLMQAVRNCTRTLKVLHLANCNSIGADDRDDDNNDDEDDDDIDGCLESLTVKSCEAVGDGFLKRVAPVCRNATTIGLVGLSSITDYGVFSLAARRGVGPAVRVSLKGCGKITDWSVVALARACGGRLEALSVEGCRGVGDRGVAVVGGACAGGLRELDVSGTAVSDAGLARLATAEDQKLEVLSVAGCEGVTDTGLGCLEVMCGGLVGLNLQRCAGVTLAGVEAFRAALWWCDVLY